MLVAVLEGAAVGALVRKRVGTALAAAGFWTAIGVPILYGWSTGVLRADAGEATAGALQQALNGVAQALLVQVLAAWPLARTWLRRQHDVPMTLRAQVFDSVIPLAVCPVIVLGLVLGRVVSSGEDVDTRRELAERAAIIGSRVDEYLRAHELATSSLAQRLAAAPVSDAEALRILVVVAGALRRHREDRPDRPPRRGAGRHQHPAGGVRGEGVVGDQGLLHETDADGRQLSLGRLPRERLRSFGPGGGLQRRHRDTAGRPRRRRQELAQPVARRADRRRPGRSERHDADGRRRPRHGDRRRRARRARHDGARRRHHLGAVDPGLRHRRIPGVRRRGTRRRPLSHRPLRHGVGRLAGVRPPIGGPLRSAGDAVLRGDRAVGPVQPGHRGAVRPAGGAPGDLADRAAGRGDAGDHDVRPAGLAAAGRRRRRRRGAGAAARSRGDGGPPARARQPPAGGGRGAGSRARRPGRDAGESRGARPRAHHGARRRHRPGRGRDPRQGRVPRQHEPRNPHADERGDRPRRDARDDAAGPAAAGAGADRPVERPAAARRDQQHPRSLEDRVGPAGRSRRRRSRCGR